MKNGIYYMMSYNYVNNTVSIQKVNVTHQIKTHYTYWIFYNTSDKNVDRKFIYKDIKKDLDDLLVIVFSMPLCRNDVIIFAKNKYDIIKNFTMIAYHLNDMKIPIKKEYSKTPIKTLLLQLRNEIKRL